jgi:hypothetical protein
MEWGINYMAKIKINSDFYGEEYSESTYAVEYLRRELNDHAENLTLDHPDGSVTKEKLSSDLRDTLTLASSGITNHEVRVKKLENDSHTHINKDALDSITAEKVSKWDGYEASINKEKNTVNERFALLNDNLETKADKADVLTRGETYMVINDALGNIQELDMKKADRTELYDSTINKADRSEIPTKASQLENDTNYVSNTDYATANVGGVVKVKNYSSGLFIGAETGELQVYPAETTDIDAKASFTKPVGVSNFDYAVSKGTHQDMSDDYDVTTLKTANKLSGEQGQLPASYNAVKGYVDDMFSTKANKSDLDWKLIGEEEVTEADITAAGEAGVTAVTIDFGKPIDSWYSETMVITSIPISSAINNFTNAKLCVLFGKTEEGAINRSDGSPALVASQGNNALLTPAWNQQHIITSNWLGKKDLTHSYVNYRGYTAATGYTVSPYTTESWSTKANSIVNCRYLAICGWYNVPNTAPVEKIRFKFPAGTKILLYGRM